MAILKLPEHFVGPLLLLDRMAEREISALRDGLRTAPVSTYTQKLSEHIARELTSTPQPEASHLADALMSLYMAKCDSNKSAAQVAKDVGDTLTSMRDSDETREVGPSDEVVQSVVEKLSHLLNVESFDLNAKATALMGEYERLFHGARVMSDVRHVFAHGDPPASIIGSVLVHNFKINYFENGEEKDIYFAMDSTDIRRLIEILNRVLVKEPMIRERVIAQGVPMISQ